jgi:hypothetical protein
VVGSRQAGAPPVPPAVADRYTLELHALAASLATPAGNEGPALLALDREAAELLLGFERDLEPRLAAGSGDLAHLAGWAAKLAGATCRLAALLHLAEHLRRRNDRNTKNNPRSCFCRFWRFCGARRYLGRPPMRVNSPVTLSNENGLSRSRPCRHTRPGG